MAIELEHNLAHISNMNMYIGVSVISLVLFIAINWYYSNKPCKYRRVSQNKRDVAFLERHRVTHVNSLIDTFSTARSVGAELLAHDITHCNLIFGIDFTISNSMQGTRSFDSKNLHSTDNSSENPYETVIRTLGETLMDQNMEDKIYAYGFGDMETKDVDVFSLSANGYCQNHEQVLNCYRSAVAKVKLSGPTNYAPVIHRAIDITRQTKKYSILVIVVDGLPTNTTQTEAAINASATMPIYVLVIGVGDGPWDSMNRFIANINKINVKFVDYNRVRSFASANEDATLALHSMVNIPEHHFTFFK